MAEGVYTREGWMERADARNGVVCGRVHGVCGFERSSLKLSHAILDTRENRGFRPFRFRCVGGKFYLVRSWTKREY